MSDAARILLHALAYCALTFAFVYDIVQNQNPFTWENAGLYAVVTIFPEIFQAVVGLKYGASRNMDMAQK